MPRHSFLITTIPLFLFGCASTRTKELVDGAVNVRPDAPSLAAAYTRTAPSLTPLEPEALPAEGDPTFAALGAPEDESLHSSRFTLKGGYYGATEDALDDGYILGVSWMNFMSKIFALEIELGYLDADGSDAGTAVDVWSVPIMINGRANVPIWILDVYGGLGVGTFYYDAEASGAISDDDDGFLWAGNAFLGASIGLADAIALGLEGKYYLTDEISDTDTTLDAYALMLTLGFSR